MSTSKKKKYKYKSLTSTQIREELKRINYKNRYSKVLKSTIYGLIIVAAASALIATLIMPVLQINSSSMSPIYDNGDFVVSIKTNKLNQNDIVAFYHGNKILVKRVIAGAGSWVVIDKKGDVYVDGTLLVEDYVTEKTIGETDIKFPYQVPDGSWFVLSDNRTDSNDSRNAEIGAISEDDIIGKILFKVWPIGK